MCVGTYTGVGVNMDYNEILSNKLLGAAAILSYKDGEITVLAINNRFIPELWMNVSESELIGADIHKSFDDDNLRIFMSTVEKCIKTGEDQTCETWRNVFSNCCGFDRICMGSRIVLLEKRDDETILFESIRNITNEKRTRDTLEDIEHRYKQASEQINIYNWEYTVATKEMRPCYRCMRDLGLPALVTNYPEPAIDMGIFPPDYADMYRDMMHQIDNGVKEIEADIPLTVGRIPFRVKYTTSFDEDGNPVKAFGSATLISETELGHIKLDNQIIASLAEEYECIYLADFKDGKVKIIKQKSILSLEPDSSCEELFNLVAPSISENNSQVNGRLLTDIELIRTELLKDFDRREFVYKDEQDNKWIRIDYHAVERGGDKVDRLLVTASVIDDIRAQKMDADKLIAEQKVELEDRQNKLLEAIDEANKANKAKTVFFSNMSHDIRTPMSAITGFSKLAMEELDDKEKLADYLDKIVNAGDHLLNLINDILDMSRIESGKMELSNTPINVKELLNECADMVRGQMQENGIDFTVNASEVGDYMVMGDKLRLRQIILNLLSNAYKFTPKGGNVALSGKLLEHKDRCTYEIRIKDNGIGMSAEFKEHIWEAFSREKSEVVNETQGTGLGMAIVKNIVTLMNGSIELESEPGKGSEFTIVLSMDEADGAGKECNRDAAVEEALNKRYDGKTILIVDDTPINIKLAEFVLIKFGFKILSAESGAKAIDMLSEHKDEIALVLMDVLMPGMDGLETTRRIRKMEDPKVAGVPIIAMTANAFASDIQDVLDAGMNAHVSKPFVKEDLITKINENLR